LTQPTVLALVSVILAAGTARSQNLSPPDSTTPRKASLTVVTDREGATLFLNGQKAGTTPLTIDTLSPGRHALLLLNPEPAGWLTENMSDTLTLEAGEARTFRYRLGGGVLINTVPSGATVLLDDSIAGLTPFILRQFLLENTRQVSLTLEGYEPAVVTAGSLLGEAIMLPLVRRWTPDTQPEFAAVQGESWEGRTLPTVASGAGAVLAGAAAAYFKIQADDRNEAYGRGGDPGVLAERNRLDRAAAVSLVIMQVGVGLFMYLLLSD
jgi:hypothetical protein